MYWKITESNTFCFVFMCLKQLIRTYITWIIFLKRYNINKNKSIHRFHGNNIYFEENKKKNDLCFLKSNINRTINASGSLVSLFDLRVFVPFENFSHVETSPLPATKQQILTHTRHLWPWNNWRSLENRLFGNLRPSTCDTHTCCRAFWMFVNLTKRKLQVLLNNFSLFSLSLSNS